MSSKKLSTNKTLTWDSELLALSSSSKPSQSLLKLEAAGIKKLKDLLWVLPLRVQQNPSVNPFHHMREGELFIGKASLVGINLSPAYGRRGKGKVQLFNATLTVKDTLSEEVAVLKFFNTYPNFKKQIESKTEVFFMGQPTLYKGSLQLVNPKIDPKDLKSAGEMLVEYPTINGVSGRLVKGIIEKIPSYLWDCEIPELPKLKAFDGPEVSFTKSFSTLHGRVSSTQEDRETAKRDLVYFEFLFDQLKVHARKVANKSMKAPIIKSDEAFCDNLLKSLPYSLTQDQSEVIDQIRNDMGRGYPMMRMIQGDVGCGKTTVAFLAMSIVAEQKGQVAMMCPTESLALQHYKNLKDLLPNAFNLRLILGSTPASKKSEIYSLLKSGDCKIVIGTHSLIQKNIVFKSLQLAIIDEQHKFGVEQRQSLSSKGIGTHTLIMSATPIPRTLQLAQYGDLDISTIRTMPKGRKGIKTRIVSEQNYQKYLSFIKTRLSLGEQIYIVVPAISESETLDINHVQGLEVEYKKFFPEYNIQSLHGRLKPEEKQSVFNLFSDQKIDVLISTSVIEVGVNVPQATVMSIYNPERFGLSSLHQLRGRVGRGDRPGFCFLISHKDVSQESLNRLKVIEQSNDGFHIAEADLKNRGEGDLFGVSQSGVISTKKIASVFEHFDIFDQVNRDLNKYSQSHPNELKAILSTIGEDQKVSSTI